MRLLGWFGESVRMFLTYKFFFFQAEDGIRDLYVTGVQTCALPICTSSIGSPSRRLRRMGAGDAWRPLRRSRRDGEPIELVPGQDLQSWPPHAFILRSGARSERISRRTRISWGRPLRGPSSFRFAETQDELIGPASDRGIKDVCRMRIGRIPQGIGFAIENKPRLDHLALHQGLVDPMHLGHPGIVESGCAGMIEDDVPAAGLERVEDFLVQRRRARGA